ncbi:MAG: HD domain-containing protein [Candidatus Odinarchaeia archaeon]
MSQIKKNPSVLEFINKTEIALEAIGYTEHGLKHSSLVAARARTVAREIGLSKEDQEFSAIAGFCHDMGNFLGREFHHYFAAFFFHQIFKDDFKPEEMTPILHALVCHDSEEMNFIHPAAAVLVLADKSDVRRGRVVIKELEKIRTDIHDRVNYATVSSKLGINRKSKIITLSLRIDTKFVPLIEYFEIFTDRMTYCRKAAEYLGYNFSLVINNFRLL